MPREPWRTRLLLLSAAANVFSARADRARTCDARPARPATAAAIVEHMAAGSPGRIQPVPPRHGPLLPEMRIPAWRRHGRRWRGRSAGSPTTRPRCRAIKAWQTAWMARSDRLGDGVVSAVSNLSPDGRRAWPRPGCAVPSDEGGRGGRGDPVRRLHPRPEIRGAVGGRPAAFRASADTQAAAWPAEDWWRNFHSQELDGLIGARPRLQQRPRRRGCEGAPGGRPGPGQRRPVAARPERRRPTTAISAPD